MKRNLLRAMLAIVAVVTGTMGAWSQELTGYATVLDYNFRDANQFPVETRVPVASLTEEYATLTNDVVIYKSTNTLFEGLAFQPAKDDDSQSWWVRLRNTATDYGLAAINLSRWFAVTDLDAGYRVTIDSKTDFADADDADNLVESKTQNASSLCGQGVSYTYVMKNKGYLALYNDNGIYMYRILVEKPIYAGVASVPTVTLTGVNGNDRVYTIKTSEGETLHYIIPGGTEQTSTGTSTNVTCTESGTLVAWTTNGDSESEKVNTEVSVGEVTLAAPAYTVTSVSAGFTKTFSVTCDNSEVLLKPTAKLTYDFAATDGTSESGVEFNGTINATVSGVYTITASADGYTSSSVTIDNTTELELSKTIDFSTVDISGNSNWTLKTADTQLPGKWVTEGNQSNTTSWYIYNIASETASPTNLVDGLNIEYSQKDNGAQTMYLYTGYGLMSPLYLVDSNNEETTTYAATNGSVSVANGTERQFVVYSYLNNYGKSGTKQTILKGNETYSLYRYSDILSKVEIYSPVLPEVNSIAEFKALEVGTEAKIKLEGVNVTFAGTEYAYIEDAEGNALELYKSGLELTQDKALTGYIFGERADVYGMPRLVASDATANSEFTEADAVATPTVVTLSELTTDWFGRLVKIEDAEMNVGWQYVSQGEDEISASDRFNVMSYETINITYNVESVVGIVTGFVFGGTTYIFSPRSVEEIVEKEIEQTQVNGIAELKKQEDETEVVLNLTNAVVTSKRMFVGGGGGYILTIEDTDGSAIRISDELATNVFWEYDFEEGNLVSGHVAGVYYNMEGEVPMLDVSMMSGRNDELTFSEGTFTPTEMTLAEIGAEDISKCIIVKGVQVAESTEADSYNEFTVTQDENSVIINDVYNMSNQFGFAAFQDEITGEYNFPEKADLRAIVTLDWDGEYTLIPLELTKSEEGGEQPNVPAPYKLFTADYKFLPTDANVTAAIAEGWVESANNRMDNKKATLDPETGDALEEPTAFDGVGLKSGNSGKTFKAYVTGVKQVAAYGVTGSGTDMRYLKMTVTTPEGETQTTAAESWPSTTTSAILDLDPTKLYTIEVTGVEADGMTGGDVALHALWLMVEGAAVDGITNVNANVNAIDADVYTLSGLKVRKAGEGLNGLAKGIYVIKGKKVVVK